MQGLAVLLPPVLTILTALIGKDVIAALFFGAMLAALVGNGGMFIDILVNEYMIEGLTGNISILLMVILTGVFMEQLSRSGGFQALSYYVGKRVKSQRGAKLFAWILCIFCSTDDGMATIGAGSIAVPVIDKYGVPRAKLAFILSSTGSNFISMMPYSMYIVFGCGLLAPYVSGDSMKIYYQGVGMNAYAILSIFTAFLMAAELLPDTRRMKEKSAKQAEECEDIEEGQKEAKGSLLSLLLPMGVMILVLAITYGRTGGFQIHKAVLSGVVVSALYQLFSGKMKIRDISGSCFKGFQRVAPIFMILFMAFTFSKALADIGFSESIAVLLGDSIPGGIFPVCVFLVCCGVSYCTGSFASGMTIMVPLALPIAVSAGFSIPLVFAACMGGSQFGDQTSPVSDIFILSSMASGVDVIESARVQLPYKLAVMTAAMLVFLILGFVSGF